MVLHQEIHDIDQMTGVIFFVWNQRAKRIFIVSVRRDEDQLAGSAEGYTWEELVEILGIEWMEENVPSIYCEDPTPKWLQEIQRCPLVPRLNNRTVWIRQPNKRQPVIVVHAPKTGMSPQRWQVEFVNTLNMYETPSFQRVPKIGASSDNQVDD